MLSAPTSASAIGVADHTSPSDKGVYIAVHNHWYCKECFYEWAAQATWYPQDADVERKNFSFYAPRLGVKCQ